MDYKVIFDSNSLYWTKDAGANRMYIKLQENYFNDLLKKRGYVYLNMIYEGLGLRWDCEGENPCFMRGKCDRITLSVRELWPYTYQVTIRVH